MSELRLVIGVGNRARKDDGAGPAVLDALQGLGAAGLETRELAGDCARLMDLWQGRETVDVVDATRSGAPPGTVIRFDAGDQEIPRDTFLHTSHAFGVAKAVETARLLGRLPPRLTVWGIEGADFAPGEALGEPVRDGVARVAAEIAARSGA